MPISASRPAADRLPAADHVRRIAVFRALFLGDFLCATPAFRALRQRFPNAEITLIGLPWTEALVRRSSSIDRLIHFPGYPGIAEVAFQPERTAAFLDEARAYRYDLAIQLHGSGLSSNGFVAALGAGVSLGYRREEGDRRLDLSLPFPDDDHEVLRWLKLVLADERQGQLQVRQPMFWDRASTATEFPVAEDEQDRAATMLARASGAGPLIGLHAGSKDPARRWPPARFAALADALVEQSGARIVLTGNDEERPITAAISRLMRHRALDLAGASDLGTFAALIGQLDGLVTNDTGASHIAAATGTPSVILFGPSRPDHWAPLDRARHRVVDALDHATPGADWADALRDLSVGPVLAACEAVLEQAAHRSTIEIRTPAFVARPLS